MPVQTYNKPELPVGAKVNTLVSSDLKAQELTPKTRVVILNRGKAVYKDKFDGRDYLVPPGYGEVEYEVANHFRLRSVVPGSRDPITGKQDHYIVILGIDKPENCQPFSDAEAVKQEQAPEALDRSAMENAVDRDVKVIKTSAARARTAGGRRRADVSVQENNSTAEAVGAMAPPVGGDAALAGQGAEVE